MPCHHSNVHGQTARALEAIETLFEFGMRVRGQTVGGTIDAALSAVARTMELRTYLEYNRVALVDYDQRRRCGKAVSTSRAEGLVNDIANARMGKNAGCAGPKWRTSTGNG